MSPPSGTGRGPRRALVAGWFSFENGHATAGDVMACTQMSRWLQAVGCEHDVALAPPFTGGVDWRKADPGRYSDVIFVCGPFQKGPLEAAFLSRYAECRMVGIDLSLSGATADWNPFDLLIARDSDLETNADIVFLAEGGRVPLLGVCRVESHPEAEVERADAAIDALLGGVEAAVVPIDTRLDANETGLRTAAEIETAIARVDLLVTTRLHGMVLALKNGVPALAIDAVPGGGKIVRQAGRIGWPLAFALDRATPQALAEALRWGLSADGRRTAAECALTARGQAQQVRDRFLAAYSDQQDLDKSRIRRTDPARLRRFRDDMATVIAAAEAGEAAEQPPGEAAEPFLRRVLRRVRGRRAHDQ